MNYLLRYLPPNLHVFLSSRRKPNFNLSKLRFQGEMAELNAGDLYFTQQEIQSLFTKIYQIPLSFQDLKRLEQHTEGWIMSLQLMAEALRGKSPEEIFFPLDRFKGSRGYIFHYFSEEVFQALPSEIQLFLKRSSILERFSVQLCASIFELEGVSELIDFLLKKHLFIIEMDEEGEWYRYHHLFRDFLSWKLKGDEEKDFIKGLHRKAACYWETKGEWRQAIRHYMLSEDFEAAADRIGEAVEELIAAGGVETLRYWLDQLPEEIVALRAGLLYARARIFDLKGHWDEAAVYYNRAKDRARVVGDRHVLGMAFAYLARLCIFLGFYELAESLAREGLKYFGEDPFYITQISIYFATSLIWLNRLEEAGREWEKLLNNPLVQKMIFSGSIVSLKGF